jgi:mannosyltransferase OCH1-like enzyme
MPEHLQKFISRAMSTGWNINLMGKDDQSHFMSILYANTSVLWAFNLIHSDAGVFASDIWRYAVLYLFGGFYLDDDSYIDAPLEKVSVFVFDI